MESKRYGIQIPRWSYWNTNNLNPTEYPEIFSECLLDDLRLKILTLSKFIFPDFSSFWNIIRIFVAFAFQMKRGKTFDESLNRGITWWEVKVSEDWLILNDLFPWAFFYLRSGEDFHAILKDLIWNELWSS